MSIFGFGLFWVTKINDLNISLKCFSLPPTQSFLVHLGRVPLENTQTLWILSCIEWSVRPSPGALSKNYYFCLRATLSVPLSLPHTRSETPRLVLWNYLCLRNTSEWTKAYFYRQNLRFYAEDTFSQSIIFSYLIYILYIYNVHEIKMENVLSKCMCLSYCAWFISPCYSIGFFSLPLKWLSFISDAI